MARTSTLAMFIDTPPQPTIIGVIVIIGVNKSLSPLTH